MAYATTAQRVFNVRDLDEDVGTLLKGLPRPPSRPQDYAAPTPMPDYAVHRDGVGPVGKLSAEAVVRDYEAAAVEIEKMGNELKERTRKCEQLVVEGNAALEEIRETAAKYRDAGKAIFLQIEDCSLMTAEVRSTCEALKAKITGASS